MEFLFTSDLYQPLISLIATEKPTTSYVNIYQFKARSQPDVHTYIKRMGRGTVSSTLQEMLNQVIFSKMPES